MKSKKLDRQAALDFNRVEPGPEHGAALAGILVMGEIQRLMKRRNKSRSNLADYLTWRLDRTIAVTTVDMWFCETKDKWPSFPILLLICDFLGSYEPLNAMAQTRGLSVIDEEGQKLLAVGEAYMNKKLIAMHDEKLERAVDGILLSRAKRGEIKL
ncbi:MAG: hypothetical protein HZB29_09895 [Nitrospinae bacterium]|nr:hypothetical protein [Nitrospinota bacterium]